MVDMSEICQNPEQLPVMQSAEQWSVVRNPVHSLSHHPDFGATVTIDDDQIYVANFSNSRDGINRSNIGLDIDRAKHARLQAVASSLGGYGISGPLFSGHKQNVALEQAESLVKASQDFLDEAAVMAAKHLVDGFRASRTAADKAVIDAADQRIARFSGLWVAYNDKAHELNPQFPKIYGLAPLKGMFGSAEERPARRLIVQNRKDELVQLPELASAWLFVQAAKGTVVDDGPRVFMPKNAAAAR